VAVRRLALAPRFTPAPRGAAIGTLACCWARAGLAAPLGGPNIQLRGRSSVALIPLAMLVPVSGCMELSVVALPFWPALFRAGRRAQVEPGC
jgi:hypothetical protein